MRSPGKRQKRHLQKFKEFSKFWHKNKIIFLVPQNSGHCDIFLLCGNIAFQIMKKNVSFQLISTELVSLGKFSTLWQRIGTLFVIRFFTFFESIYYCCENFVIFPGWLLGLRACLWVI